MAETHKDSIRGKIKRLSLEVTANPDGTFEIILNQKLVGTRIPEEWLNAELCGKYGFCGDEFAAIERELMQHGRYTTEM